MLRFVFMSVFLLTASAFGASAAEQAVRFVGNGFFPQQIYVHNGTQLHFRNNYTSKARINMGGVVFDLDAGEERTFNYGQWKPSSGNSLTLKGGIINGGNVNWSSVDTIVQVDVGAPIWAKKKSN
ncbi:hypothetical protein [Pseudoprimorskyibacter insulae]|uniref:Uncharacterized protein n=1 Tax=Pseudoprimorskyibacter insulae TaxID=1695997 RepID=A0A2R8APF0_9RHOB|nr:hypothetical protein [Pseudoprimorskyibacter insulae]SPF77921.1 hypothetical protein PRI8871_00508 [Pseudoprimorskyibacter insulae]